MNGKSIHTWIVDTGASIHVFCDDSLFDNCCSNHPVAGGLPNRSSLEAIKIGSVKINNDLGLTNVFYVPTFNCNLISVSQLLSTRKLSILITDLECVIQDHASRMKIGVGKLVDGFYWMTMGELTRVNVVAGKKTFELWHKRLGRPSLQTMGHLPHITRDKINFDITACDVCHRAKQTGNVFPLSENKTNSLFELIHCDVWDTYHQNRAVILIIF